MRTVCAFSRAGECHCSTERVKTRRASKGVSIAEAWARRIRGAGVRTLDWNNKTRLFEQRELKVTDFTRRRAGNYTGQSHRTRDSFPAERARSMQLRLLLLRSFVRFTGAQDIERLTRNGFVRSVNVRCKKNAATFRCRGDDGWPLVSEQRDFSGGK